MNSRDLHRLLAPPPPPQPEPLWKSGLVILLTGLMGLGMVFIAGILGG